MFPARYIQAADQSPALDLDSHFDENIEIVQEMIPDMDETLLHRAWNSDLDLFFIDGKFSRFRQSAKPAADLLFRLVGAEQAPSFEDVVALTTGRAISLVGVCKLCYSLDVALERKDEAVLQVFNPDAGSPVFKQNPVRRGTVISSINVFDKDRYVEVKGPLNIASGELTFFASKEINRNLNVGLFEEALEKGSLSKTTGQPTGHNRLTDFMAEVVYRFLESKAKDKPTFELKRRDYFMPRDPLYGRGNGKWCRSLPRSEGNYWRRKA